MEEVHKGIIAQLLLAGDGEPTPQLRAAQAPFAKNMKPFTVPRRRGIEKYFGIKANARLNGDPASMFDFIGRKAYNVVKSNTK